ncbi:MAG: hypothetical protein ACRDDY_04555 [Clostridium sp.]|uniref:hypothetical protein n=1 Tax=Clostridium sp. TaxID=1506 RepID=UPI003EE6F129
MTEKVRIELLNDGGYAGLGSVTFPIVVDATPLLEPYTDETRLYNVRIEDLLKIVTTDFDREILMETRDMDPSDPTLPWSVTAEECRPL